MTQERSGGRWAIPASDFTELFAEYLVEVAQLSDFELCFMERKHGRVMVRVNAWSVDPDEGQLEIVATIFRDAFQPSIVSAKDVEAAAKQAANLVDLARSKSYLTIEPSSPEYAMLHAIDSAWEDLTRIRVVVIVDGVAKDADLTSVQVPGRWSSVMFGTTSASTGLCRRAGPMNRFRSM